MREALAAGQIDTGEQLAPAAVRRLACDAALIPAVLGTHGEDLDIGRTQRLVTPALWRALVLRDAHHLHHWADGGHPSLDNLASR